MIEPVTVQKNIDQGSVLFQGFPRGLNTSVPSFQLTQTEMAECINWKINAGGQLETRSAITKFSTVAITNSVYSVESAVISGTNRTIICGSDYKIYYLNGTEPTLIGTAKGTSYLFPYNNCCMVCDGSYLKYLDNVSTLKMAYDAGDNGTQYDNYSGEDDSGIAIGNGTNEGAAVKFTSDTWDSGFTMPVTQFSVFLQRVNPGPTLTGTITARLRLVSTGVAVASKACTQAPGDISTDGEFVDFIFSASDVTTEMASNTAYYATIEYDGGDASNYLSLRCSDNGDFTNTGYAGTVPVADFVWAVDTGKNPIFKVYPGLPPKCSFGWVSKARPWFAGDPDNPGYVWYGNLTHLDFSTTDSGGYIGVIDGDRNSFAIGGGGDLYGEMFVYGTEAQPYIARLDGTTPADYSLLAMFQRGWTTQRALKNVGNDLWTGSDLGVDALSGVQQYGDVRTFSASDLVKDKFAKYWDSTKSFAGYYPDDGQYWVFMNHTNYDKVLVGHTKQPFQMNLGVGYPWTEYDIPCSPTAFGTSTVGFMIGADDGFLYRPDTTAYKDLDTTQILPSFRAPYQEFPFRQVHLIDLHVMMSSLAGADMTISIYKDGNESTPLADYSFSIPISDSMTVDDLIMDIEDWGGTIYPGYSPMFFDINTMARSFQIKVSDVKISGYPVFFNGCAIKYRQLKGL